MKTCKTLSELYSHPGFRARNKLTGIYGDRYARVIQLVRRQKTVCSVCHTPSKTHYDSEIKRARDLSSGSFRDIR